MNALAYMVVKDNLPLRTPQKKGFLFFCKKLQPLYKPPSRIILTNFIEEKYKYLAEKVKDELVVADSICLTCDLWTHKYTMKTYLGVTAHYLNETTFEMQTIELGAYIMGERKTIDNLKLKLREICKEWKISDDQIEVVVSDGGPNIKGAIKQEFGELKHISCFAHAINNIGQQILEFEYSNDDICLSTDEDGDDDDLQIELEEENSQTSSLKKLIEKVKIIVRYFKSSSLASEELEKLQVEAGSKNALKLIQEVRTKWNSCYAMADRFIMLESYVGRVLLHMLRNKSSRTKHPNMLNGDELEELIDVRDLLKPLWRITNEVSAEKSVTLSKCIPLILGLKLKIEALKPNTSTGKMLKDKILKEIHNKFANIEAVKKYGIATLLDPRYKKNAFSSIENTGRAIQIVAALVKLEMEMMQVSFQNQIDEANDKELGDTDDILSFLVNPVK